jgi:SUKH-3 immunity protein
VSSDPKQRAVISPVDGRHIIPVDIPGVVGGFRFPSTLDGVNEDATPHVSPERGFLRDPAERERVLGYLTAGARVLETMRYSADGFDRTRQFAVRVGYRTDGVWVWPDSVEYYLREHAVAPEPDFLRHIVANGYRCPSPPPEVIRAADRAMRERAAIGNRMKHEYAKEHGLLRPERTGDPTRFPPRVNAALLTMGWDPGRDVRGAVDTWLARTLPTFADAAFERDGFPPYRPNPAALRAMYEFGGLAFGGGGRGVSMATTAFRILPACAGVFRSDGDVDHDDPADFMINAQLLGRSIGKSVFQVGEVSAGLAALVVAEDGEVYMAGTMDFYIGRTFDIALQSMILGITYGTLDAGLPEDEAGESAGRAP